MWYDSEESLAHRKEHFKAEFTTPHHPSSPDEMSLRVTQNGHQWHGISLLSNEGRIVARMLINHYGIEAIMKGDE